MRRFLFLSIIVVMVLLPVGIFAATYEADYVPWSGDWWAFGNGELVRGYYPRWEPSPLAKYDYVTSGSYNGKAMAYGRENYFNTEALGWEGLCMAWAAAAILEPEPVHKCIYEGLPFCVGDKKGLLTVAYDGPGRVYQVVNTPLGFHQVLEDIIRTQGMPLIIDTGSGEEIWNFPVYKYDSSYTVTGNIRHYTVTIYMADDDVHPDDVGTKVRDRRYYYFFEMDGETVVDSGWEAGSQVPKMGWMPFGAGGAIDNNVDYETVQEIVTTNGDAYEGNDTPAEAVELENGYYTLVALGTDWFRVRLESGDRLDIRLMADVDGSAQHDGGFTLKLFTPSMECVREVSVDERSEGHICYESTESGDYYCSVEPLLPSREPFYDLTLQRELAFHGYFPTMPAGLWVTGLALLDTVMNDGRIDLTAIDENGNPRTNYRDDASSFHMGIAGKNFGLSCPGKGYVRVDSDHKLNGLHVTRSAWDPRMHGSNIISRDRASDRLFFPDLREQTYMCDPRFGIINVGDNAETVERSFYNADGELLVSDSIAMAPGEKAVDHISDVEEDAAAMRATATSGRDCLIGYLEFWTGLMYKYKTATLVPLPLARNTRLIVPHVASGVNWPGQGIWQTEISVMNTGDAETAVTFTAHDSVGDEISSVAQVLQPNQPFKSEAGELFPSVSAPSIAAVNIESDGAALAGFVTYGPDGGDVSAAIPLTGPGESRLCLPHLACNDLWRTGVSVMNAGTGQTTTVFSLMDETGEILDQAYRSLQANERWVGTVTGLFGATFLAEARWLQAESVLPVQPLCGLYLMTTKDGLFMNGDIME